MKTLSSLSISSSIALFNASRTVISVCCASVLAKRWALGKESLLDEARAEVAGTAAAGVSALEGMATRVDEERERAEGAAAPRRELANRGSWAERKRDMTAGGGGVGGRARYTEGRKRER